MWLRVLILLAGLCFFPAKSFAMSCTVSTAPNVSFAPLNPFNTGDLVTQVTLSYKCTKTALELLSVATLCFNIPASGGTAINPRKMTAGGSTSLNYQLYQDTGYSVIWGSQYITGYPSQKIFWNVLNVFELSGNLTIYAKIPGGQLTTAPGNYQDLFTITTGTITANVTTILTDNSCGTTPVGSFAFTVSTVVNKQCSIGTTNNINLGSAVDHTQTNIMTSGTFPITCTNTTPFTIGLIPSNNSATGSGVMQSSTTSNMDKVPYQLNSTSGVNGVQWGNGTSNIVSGAGTGSPVNQTVYVVAPSANYTPDTYSDTVTINVTY